jgi:hypothetical protein
MVLLFLGIALIVSIYLFTVVPYDDCSTWGEEYMDDEFKKLKSE